MVMLDCKPFFPLLAFVQEFETLKHFHWKYPEKGKEKKNQKHKKLLVEGRTFQIPWNY